jgi:hypothetical protein
MTKMLKTILIVSAALCAMCFAVRADDTIPDPLCHKIAEIQSVNDAKSTWVHLTPDQLKVFRASFGIPAEAVDMWADLPPGYETWTLFGFTDKGCMQGKGSVTNETFTSLVGDPT